MSFCGLIKGMHTNKRSFEPLCGLIPQDFSGCYRLISFECMHVSLVDHSSNMCVCVGGGEAWFGLLNCSSSVYI